MTQFASADDLASRLGLSFTDEEQNRANVQLIRAAGLIQDAVGQTIALVEDDEITRPGTTDERIALPQRPVVSVASVKLDGEEFHGWYLDRSEIVSRNRSVFLAGGGRGNVLRRGFGNESRTLTIVYTHGYAEIPELVKAICVEMAVRIWVNPGSVIQEAVGGVDTTYAPYAAPPRGLLLTDDELKQLRNFFGRRAHSVTIGS